MSFVPSSALIQVDMSVTRYRLYPEDGMVEVWGHVGDYEVCLYLTMEQAQVRGLFPVEARRPSGRGVKKGRT